LSGSRRRRWGSTGSEKRKKKKNVQSLMTGKTKVFGTKGRPRGGWELKGKCGIGQGEKGGGWNACGPEDEPPKPPHGKLPPRLLVENLGQGEVLKRSVTPRLGGFFPKPGPRGGAKDRNKSPARPR